MFNGHELIKEEALRFDSDATRLQFTKSEEAPTMTKEQFVTHLIQHAETFPDVGEITEQDAQTVLDNLAPSSAIPEITAAELTDLWNRLIHDQDVMEIY